MKPKTHVNHNTFNPYVPLTRYQAYVEPFTKWQVMLDALHQTHALGMFRKDALPQDGPTLATEAMQEIYPGNYVVIEKYNADRQRFVYDIEFSSPEDQAFFILKYGD